MKKYFLLLFLIVPNILLAQNKTVSITGTVIDGTTQEPVEQANIRIMNVTDSTYVNGTATNQEGKFNIKIAPGNYLIGVTFLGYTDTYINLNAIKTQNSIGTVALKDDGIFLSEAIVVGKAPDIVIKGDTVEYNADSYKVQDNAVLEDLLKRIPGAEIDADGKITVNGKDISKILVDGKEFFSDDPKTASQNLPAKMVEKLQVLDKKSDMAQITGFDDGEEETVINLVVKPEMKQGLIANALVGYGSEDKYEVNGFINYMKGDSRITVLGNMNNNNNENANSWGGGRGILKTTETGMNFASEPSKKLKYDGDISYSHTNNDLKTSRTRDYTRQENESNAIMRELGSNTSINKDDRLRSRFRLEWAPDTLTKLIFRPRISYNKSNSLSNGWSSRKLYDEFGEVINNENNFETDPDYSISNSSSFGVEGSLLFNRKLNDKGRSITLELSGGYDNGDGDGEAKSITNYTFYEDSTQIIDQIYDQKNKSYNWRARISYLEPIGRNNFLELSYNIRNSYSSTDKKTYNQDPVTGEYTILDEDYTRDVQNRFLNQNVTLSFQSRREKFNYTLGLGLEPSTSKTKIVPSNNSDEWQSKNYLSLVPKAEFNYLWDRRHNLRLRYDGRTTQPSTTQLFDGRTQQNGIDITLGNPNLKPSFRHNFNLRYQKYNAEKASSIHAFGNFSYRTNDIVTVTRWEGNGRINTYENIDGNMEGFFRAMYNTPLRNKKFSVNSGTFGNYKKDNTYISSDEAERQKNTANTFRIGERLSLKFNSDAFQFDVGANFSYESTRHSISKERNQNVCNYGGMGRFTWYLPYKFVLESDINYSSNSGYEAGYKQNSWLWNASFSKELFQNATVRIKVYDILKDRSNVSYTSSADYNQYTSYNTISSYFMVNFIYKFQSFAGGAKMPEDDRPGPGPGRFHRGGPPRF